jgi:hypothetical protein
MGEPGRRPWLTPADVGERVGIAPDAREIQSAAPVEPEQMSPARLLAIESRAENRSALR